MGNDDMKCDGCSCEYCADPATWRVEAWFEEVSLQDEGYTVVCMCDAHHAEFEQHSEHYADEGHAFYWHDLVYIERDERIGDLQPNT